MHEHPEGFTVFSETVERAGDTVKEASSTSNRGALGDTPPVELLLVGNKPLSEAAFFSGEDPNTFVINATRLMCAGPLDVAGVVAMAHWAASDAMRVTLRLPDDGDAATYLQRMDVLRQMPPETSIHGRVHPNARSDHRDTLLEVTTLNQNNVNDLSERLGPLITGFYKGRSSAAGAAIFRACSELISNATEHGASPQGAYVAAQLTSGTTSESLRLEFAVCDTGIGVMHHLRRNAAYAHYTRDELAIAKAVEPGVSGVGAVGRGNGLSDAVEDSRQSGSVELQIRSGKGEVRVVGNPRSATVSKARSRQDQTAGTWAWLTHRLTGSGQTVLQSVQ